MPRRSDQIGHCGNVRASLATRYRELAETHRSGRMAAHYEQRAEQFDSDCAVVVSEWDLAGLVPGMRGDRTRRYRVDAHGSITPHRT